MGHGRRYSQSHARGPCSGAMLVCSGGVLREACLGRMFRAHPRGTTLGGILGGHPQGASGACFGGYYGGSSGGVL